LEETSGDRLFQSPGPAGKKGGALLLTPEYFLTTSLGNSG